MADCSSSERVVRVPPLLGPLSRLLLACLTVYVLTFHAFAAPGAKYGEGRSAVSSAEADRSRACARISMTVVAAPPGAEGLFCAPNDNSTPSKIITCLKIGMEAVLIPEAPGVVCATPKKGRDFLDRNEAATEKRNLYKHPHKLDPLKTCEEQNDPRILGGDIIKVLLRQAKKDIDPTGIRIIGAIFCSYLDLNGVNLPYSLVLDRSIVAGKDSQVDIRNFRTRGDLSLDNTVVYTSVRIRRSEISGSLYAQRAFFNKLEIGDSTIKGSAIITLTKRRLNVDIALLGASNNVRRPFRPDLS